MSELSKSYTIDLTVRDDKIKDTIREVENGFNKIGKSANLDDAEKATESIIRRMQELAKEASSDFSNIQAAYARSSFKAISDLEKQYEKLREAQEKANSQRTELEDLKKSKELQAKNAQSAEEYFDILKDIGEINKKIKDLNIEQYESQIMRNRQLRANLKDTERQIKLERQQAKLKDIQKRKDEIAARLEEAQNKSKQLRFKLFSSERKENEEQIKQLKEKLKLIQEEGKVRTQVAQTASKISKKEKSENRARNIQNFYNITGIAGGAGRMISGASGMISGAVQSVIGTADRAVELERNANRVKGFKASDAQEILSKLYLETGADYSSIVDAINRVQSVIKTKDMGEIIQATAMEIKYPGMAAAFASSNTEANMGNFNIYANRMKSMQKVTGASDDQMREATQKLSNMKIGDFNSSSVTELQSLYLGLQNSGAFDSQDELDAAFRRFVRKQRDSGENVFDFAQKFDWEANIHGQRNKLQASNTIQNMDWGTMKSAMSEVNSGPVEKSSAEQMAINARTLSQKKDELLIKLIPLIEPIVTELSKFMESDGAKKIIDGLVSFLTKGLPILTDVLLAIGKNLGVMVDSVNEAVDKSVSYGIAASETGSLIGPKFSNGGLAFMPSIVGERGPEAIIPLDYSRAQRAENIANTVNQTFNMGSNQSTALSLAQAVRSRNFTRAMTDNQFFTRRCGAF